MTITIQAPPDVEEKLIQAAAQDGLSIEDYALVAVLQKADMQAAQARINVSPPGRKLSPTAALFEVWAAEDATDDPEELAKRQRETDEMLENLRVNRMDFEGWTDLSFLLADDEESDGLSETQQTTEPTPHPKAS